MIEALRVVAALGLVLVAWTLLGLVVAAIVGRAIHLADTRHDTTPDGVDIPD